jgi:hypothetical protein
MANHGPVGQPRNGVLMWLVYWLGCCIIGWLIVTFVWMKKTLEEIKAFTQKDGLLAPILFFIPIVGWIQILLYAKALKETQQKIGMPEAEQINPIMVFILFIVAYIGIMLFQNNVNKTWEFVNKNKK